MAYALTREIGGRHLRAIASASIGHRRLYSWRLEISYRLVCGRGRRMFARRGAGLRGIS